MSDSDLDAELKAEESALETPPESEAPKDGAEANGEDREPMMPVAAHVAERKELQKRVEFAEEVARRSATPAVDPIQDDPVDFLAEPEKIAGFIDQKIKQATEGLSRRYAVRQHGKKAVDEAHAALKKHGNQAEQQALAASADPWGEVVDWHKRGETMAEIGDDPVAWRKLETERIRKELLAQATVRQAKGLDPAVSLAGEPNLGARDDDAGEPGDSLTELIGE